MSDASNAVAGPPATDAAPVGAEDILEELRGRLATGQRLSAAAWSELHRAIHAIDPTATEDVIAPLAGNGSSNIYRALIAWAPMRPGERVLDVGCGSGGATRAAAEAVGAQGSVVGIDPCVEVLAAARERTEADLPITYRRMVAEQLAGLEDRSFDCVIASLVLEELADMPAALREIVRVLRPGGRFVASVFAFDTLRPQDASLMGSVLATVARHAPGALAGRASRASIPHEPADAAAFKDAGLLVPEERDLQFSVVLDSLDDAWAFFGRSKIAHILGPEGREDLRAALDRRMPHSLALPIRFMRTRRPG